MEERRAVGREAEAVMEGYGWRKVTTGTWRYDRIVPMEIAVWAKPARLAYSRYSDEDYQIDENRPIPETKDGFLYFCSPGNTGEYMTVEEAKSAADAEPWGPVKWD